MPRSKVRRASLYHSRVKTLRANLADGSHIDITIPVETWMLNASHTFTIDTPTAATSVVLDPNHSIPLIDRAHTTLSIGSSN